MSVGRSRVVERQREALARQSVGREERERLVERRPPRRDHRRSGPRQPERDRLPDAGVRAGDQRPLAVEAEGVAHRKSPIATISTSL